MGNLKLCLSRMFYYRHFVEFPLHTKLSGTIIFIRKRAFRGPLKKKCQARKTYIFISPVVSGLFNHSYPTIGFSILSNLTGRKLQTTILEKKLQLPGQKKKQIYTSLKSKGLTSHCLMNYFSQFFNLLPGKPGYFRNDINIHSSF
jgi:hypothetical protein